jgi:8-oxo-dGTP diphosphatase
VGHSHSDDLSDSVTLVPQTVVGAILVDSLERPSYVVAARRTKPTELAGRWEFPGGKVEAAETPTAGLVREVREELGVGITVGQELVGPDDGWPISEDYVLRLYFAVVTSGALHRSEDHDELRRLTVADLDSVAWLPSDLQAIPALRAVMAAPTGRGRAAPASVPGRRGSPG